MGAPDSWRMAVVLASGVTTGGCAVGAVRSEWTAGPLSTPGFNSPADVQIVVTSTSAEEEEAEAMTALLEGCMNRLRAKGFHPVVLVPPQAPTAPAVVRIQVVEWDPGSRALRAFVGFGSGEASITATFDEVLLPDPSPKLTGTVRGSMSSGWSGGSALEAAKSAGVAIADAVVGQDEAD